MTAAKAPLTTTHSQLPALPHKLNKKGTRIEIQSRFKIQYPMKNHTTNANGQLKLRAEQ